mgnify:CR=1 FL=1
MPTTIASIPSSAASSSASSTRHSREAGRLVEQVLPVVHVEGRIRAIRGGIRRREVDEDVARVAELLAAHAAHDLDRAGDARAAAFERLFVVKPLVHRRRTIASGKCPRFRKRSVASSYKRDAMASRVRVKPSENAAGAVRRLTTRDSPRSRSRRSNPDRRRLRGARKAPSPTLLPGSREGTRSTALHPPPAREARHRDTPPTIRRARLQDSHGSARGSPRARALRARTARATRSARAFPPRR